MNRRNFVKISAGSILAANTPGIAQKIGTQPSVVVVGAGVFGLWTALYLQEQGAKVTLLDAYGPGNSRGSSGGESRIIRSEYGKQFLYTRLNNQAYDLLKSWEKEWNTRLTYNTGRLTLGNESYRAQAQVVQADLAKFGVPSELLSKSEIAYRWPQIHLEGIESALYFPGGAGGTTVMARKSLLAVAEAFEKKGGKISIEQALRPQIEGGHVKSLKTSSGKTYHADLFVFACGPWMAKVFPDIFQKQQRVFRREVFFIGSPAGDTRYAHPNFPVWLDGNMYGMPDIEGQGFKVAPFPDNNPIDPDTDERLINPYMMKQVHDYVAKRFPGLANQPIVRTNVCQLTFSKDEHFIIDTHPQAANLWFMGTGSGHGFKHGPALGLYMANRLLNNVKEPELDAAFRLKEGF